MLLKSFTLQNKNAEKKSTVSVGELQYWGLNNVR